MPPDRPQIDPSLLQRCPDLPTDVDWKLEADGSLSRGEATKEYGKLQGQYNGCAIRMDCLIEAVTGDAKTAKSKACIARPTKDGK